MGAKRTTRAHLAATLLIAVSLAACSSASAPAGTTVANPKAAKPAGSWPYPNGDLANTRNAAGSVISSANVGRLQQAWTFKLSPSMVTAGPGFGSLAATPVVAGGVVYLQDLGGNVYALDLGTGQVKWEYQVSSKVAEGGPNGVAVSGGVVYGDTTDTVFALSASTGTVIWTDQNLLNDGQGVFGIQPQVANGRIYLASSIGTGPGGGVLLALDARTGKLDWQVNTMIRASTSSSTSQFGTGGAWETPLVGRDGSVTFGVGNPYQTAASAIAHPSAQLYADSDVNLDAATGQLRWYYQAVPNDFLDHDLQTSPIAVTIDGAPAVIASGKMGVVYAMNASTGKLIWQAPVGEHGSSDSYPLAAMAHKLTLKAPYTFLPGGYGGVLSNPAVADGTVYVATVNLPFTISKLTLPLGIPHGTGTGEIEALNLATGKVEWDTRVPAMPLGAATISNDLVFTTLYTGILVALNRGTGAIVYEHKLPTSANAPIAIAGNAVLVPAGGPNLFELKGRSPQLVAYTVQ